LFVGFWNCSDSMVFLLDFRTVPTVWYFLLDNSRNSRKIQTKKPYRRNSPKIQQKIPYCRNSPKNQQKIPYCRNSSKTQQKILHCRNSPKIQSTNHRKGQNRYP
jgi:hypothetical protein